MCDSDNTRPVIIHTHVAVTILLAINHKFVYLEISVSISPRALIVYNKVNMVDTVLDTFDSLFRFVTLISKSLINVLVLLNP